MALAARVVGAGFSPGQAKGLCGGVATGLSAAGSTQATATSILSSIVAFSTVSAGTGAILPSCEVGDSVTVYNDQGTNNLAVYPDSGSKINALATNGADYIPPNTSTFYTRITSTRWIANRSA